MICKTCEYLFLKYLDLILVQHLDYCSDCLIVPSLKCWYSQGHICYMYSHPNLTQIKFLSNLLVSGGRESPDIFPEILGLVRTFSVFMGIYILLPWLFFFFTAYRVDRQPSPLTSLSPPPLPLPLLARKAIFKSLWPNLMRVRDWELQGV
jgi:hypothetical protein